MTTTFKEYEPLQNIPLDVGSPVTIIPRAEWIAMPPKIIEYITHPIIKCYFGVENQCTPCKTKEECMKAVKNIQNHYYDRGMEDLPYNFLVGNDGNVYEGRGWLYKPGPETSFKRDYRDHTIQVGLIGGHDVATDETMGMLRECWIMAKRLCNYGVELKYVSKDYEIHGFKDDLFDFNIEYRP